MAPSVPANSVHYALVIDAGSSGSRLHIYSWRDPGLERAEIVAEVREARAAGMGSGAGESSTSNSRWWWWDSIKGKGKASAEEMELRALRRLVRVGKGVKGEEWVKRVQPGISTVTPDDIPSYLAPLLAHALDHIPPSRQAQTPIYVLATAGMRRLSDEDQRAILRATCDTLRRDYPFAVNDESSDGPCGDSVRIISGEEEGIWGWVAVNYLMDGFGHAPELAHSPGATEHDHLLPLPALAAPPPGGGKGSQGQSSVTPVDVNHHSPTFGFLDMGGASTQLAFSPTAEELARSRFPQQDLSMIRLRLLSGELVEWPVFAASWLDFGTNRVRDRYVDAKVKMWNEEQKAVAATDPKASIVDACLPKGLVVPAPSTSTHPDFVGSGSFTECLTSLKPLLGQDKPCPAEHCLFNGLATPHIDFSRADQRGFIGVSEYWYTAHQVLGLGGVWDWTEWERSMNEFCSQDWASIEKKIKSGEGWRGNEIELSRMQMQCFKGAWISNVLHEGIGIPRVGDRGGNNTLTGNDSALNDEAERRAKEKGLLSHAHKPSHFQSMDEVRATAISWTLGKVVIEASRAVGEREGPGLIDRIATATSLDLTSIMWLYIGVAALLLFLLFGAVRRRTGLCPGSGRRRKRLEPRTWVFPWLTNGSGDAYAFEEGGGSLDPAFGSGKSRLPPSLSRLRLWGRRVTNVLRRNVSFASERPRNRRHVSMPLTNGSPYMGGSSGWSSQPPSPGRGERDSRSGVSSASASASFYNTRSTSMLDMAGNSLATPSSPPRGGSSPRLPGLRSVSSGGLPRPRQNSSHSAPYLEPHSGAGGGWNDPPMSMLATPTGSPALPSHGLGRGYESTDDERSGTGVAPKRSGVLTPSAEGFLSRNSSRVNLSDMGLAQRTASRAATPGYDEGTP